MRRTYLHINIRLISRKTFLSQIKRFDKVQFSSDFILKYEQASCRINGHRIIGYGLSMFRCRKLPS